MIIPVGIISAGDNVDSFVISSNNIPLICFTASHEVVHNSMQRGDWGIACVPEDRLLCTSLGCLVAVALHGDRMPMMADW